MVVTKKQASVCLYLWMHFVPLGDRPPSLASHSREQNGLRRTLFAVRWMIDQEEGPVQFSSCATVWIRRSREVDTLILPVNPISLQ